MTDEGVPHVTADAVTVLWGQGHQLPGVIQRRVVAGRLLQQDVGLLCVLHDDVHIAAVERNLEASVTIKSLPTHPRGSPADSAI